MNFTFINKWSIRDLPVIVTTTHYSFKVWCQCSNFYEIISYKPFICVWTINFYNFLIKAPLCGLLIVISRSILWSACPSNIFSPLVLVWLILHSHSANGQRINRDLDYSPLNVLYFPTWTLSVCWAKFLTVSSRLMEFGERLWMVNDEWINAEWKQSANARAKWRVTVCERKMNDLFRVPWELSLHWVSSLIRKK